MTEKRFRQLTLEDLSPEQRPLGEAIMKVSSIGLQGPYNPMPDEAVLYDFVIELYTKHKVRDATFANAKAQFTEQQIVDLTSTAGTYG
jgi:alkylhydroperoxidase family enzyme